VSLGSPQHLSGDTEGAAVKTSYKSESFSCFFGLSHTLGTQRGINIGKLKGDVGVRYLLLPFIHEHHPVLQELFSW
jgi:hypothetical protein